MSVEIPARIGRRFRYGKRLGCAQRMLPKVPNTKDALSSRGLALSLIDPTYRV